MTTAIVHARRNWMPTFTLLLAGGAAALGVVAITTDDVATTTPAQAPAPVTVRAQDASPADVPLYQRMPAGWPATEVMRQEAAAGSRARDDAELMPAGWPATEAMRQTVDCTNGPARGPVVAC